jgi:trimeric autotransporter adhesin
LNQVNKLVSYGRDPARSLPLWRRFLLIPLILLCFALSPNAQAAPAPETPDPISVAGTLNTADGHNALRSATAASAGNSAFGGFSLFSLTTGNFNTACGVLALDLNNADSNTAVGAAALLFNTVGAGADTGTQNAAVGTAALENNIGGANDGDGSFNDAVGAFSLFTNTTGASNNGFGNSTLFNNTTGSANTAIGDVALSHGSGDDFSLNTAVGAGALFTSTAGNSNNAIGVDALTNDDSVGFNNAFGVDALVDNVSGDSNTAVGDSAGIGNTSGFGNIYIGAFTETVPDGESLTIRIGDLPGGLNFPTACFIGGITGVPVTGTAVVVNGNGKLGVAPSSKRFKNQIKPMDKESESILALKPVTFRYKQQIDPNRIPQFGLVAEDVAKVNPDLVIRDRDGKPYTVRYDAVNAMLLNEFIKEHQTVQELKATSENQQTTIALQEAQIKSLTASLKEQAAQIHKVNAQLEMIRPTPQVVENR